VKDFVIGVAMMAGPVIAWHMLVVSRRWDDPTALPSGSETDTAIPPAVQVFPGPDGPDRCLRFVPVTTTTYGAPVRHNRNPYLCLKPLPCTAVHADDILGRAT
jgi:hypothetical protein